MSRDVPTTRYFAVGFFTAEQLEAKDRALLAGAALNETVSDIPNAANIVSITVFGIDTGSETVDLAVRPISLVVKDPSAGGVSFAVERFDSTQFPGSQNPEEAFNQYLASAEGIASFGTATAVQLIAIDIDAAPDPAAE
jgi:hypothetical protein